MAVRKGNWLVEKLFECYIFEEAAYSGLLLMGYVS